MFQFLAGESANEQGADYAQTVVTEGQKICEDNSWEEKYPMLAAGLESSDPREQYINGYTAILMRNEAMFVEGAAKRYGESTVSSFLGDIAPRIMDVVRVFAPNTIAHIIANAQPLTAMTGQIVVIKPTFTSTAAGVSAGDEVFKDQTDGTYASEQNTDTVGTGDGSTKTFNKTLTYKVRYTDFACQTGGQTTPVSIKVDGVEVATDDGAGTITGTGITGTIDYDTKALSLTWTTAPTAGQVITCEYYANSESDATAIRELQLGLNVIPVVAKSHPLRLSWSVQAQLAATAAIALDVEDTLSVIAGQFLKIERDRQLIRYIGTLAGAVDTDLVFDAVAVSGLSRREKFGDFVITLNQAKREIFTASGRGSVSWIVAGTTAAVVIKSMPGFVPAAAVTPIGAHVVGTVDGVTVIEDPAMVGTTGSAAPTEYLVGYNGILPGDSGVIIADWIPVYFTPTDISPDLQGKKALLSMYDRVANVTTYYKRGRIDNV